MGSATWQSPATRLLSGFQPPQADPRSAAVRSRHCLPAGQRLNWWIRHVSSRTANVADQGAQALPRPQRPRSACRIGSSGILRLKRRSISVSAESAHAETCERMAGSLGPEMLTFTRLLLSGLDLPRMLRPKSVIIKLTHYQCAGLTLAQGRAEMRGSHNLAVADIVGPSAINGENLGCYKTRVR
jgi:hypothetical protein